MSLSEQDITRLSEAISGIISSKVGGCRDHIGFAQRISTIEADYKHLQGSVDAIAKKQDETNSKVDKINDGIQKMFFKLKDEELEEAKGESKEKKKEIKEKEKETQRKKELHVGWLITIILGGFKLLEWLPALWAWVLIHLKGTP